MQDEEKKRRYTIKRWFICYIVDQQYTHGSPVISYKKQLTNITKLNKTKKFVTLGETNKEKKKNLDLTHGIKYQNLNQHLVS